MTPIYPKQDSQCYKVLMKLIEAGDDWTSGTVFLRSLYLSQFHARIWDLENKYHWNIEHSDFTDENGFLSYRLSNKPKQTSLFQFNAPTIFEIRNI